jgi:hypothetical protein
MTKTQGLISALVLASLTGLAGCAGSAPVATSPEGHAPQAQIGDRHVMSIENPMTFDQLVAAIPKRLTAEEAKQQLVQIDPSKVVEQTNSSFSVQQIYRPFYSGFYPFYHSAYSSFYYYPYRNYYIPYYSYGSYYYPYTYGYNSLYYYPYSYLSAYSTYSPFLYNYRSLYYPFYYRYGRVL